MSNQYGGLTQAEWELLAAGANGVVRRDKVEEGMEGSGDLAPTNPPRKPGREPIYPWDEWLDGKEHIVQCNTRQVRITKDALQRRLGSRATRDGLYVWTQSSKENPNELWFQFFKTLDDKKLAQTRRAEAEWEADNMEGGPEPE